MSAWPHPGEEVTVHGCFGTVIAVNRSRRKVWVDGPDIGDRIVPLNSVEPVDGEPRQPDRVYVCPHVCCVIPHDTSHDHLFEPPECVDCRGIEDGRLDALEMKEQIQ